ncbi:MAG: PIN domain-containing protein [Candidatus Aminicenantes bacterium]|nr:PIN domain-containing protein [Candidatus Aminicenantes bacterium]NIM78348.1 PIN domain-containing protein [Candidatus Aminicenantes bacterium]NIN17582.1 PIN domain-containing protein [Candidatus Aminicenantes bacterium]NIN41460.1 PIN domain-containing protein [Candidatus Aminicenantes bacterium]NIN84234.1 PIN domain-containing protein [Candidatus Aminicenantes bacterium]
MIYLIDTDIVIYSLKNQSTVKYNFRKHANDPKMISVITYGELIHGAKKSRDHQKNTATVHRISELFPVVDVTKSIMETFADIKTVLQRQGNIIDDMDLIIAATAITMNYTLVTNNEKHFSRISDLRIENWAVK